MRRGLGLGRSWIGTSEDAILLVVVGDASYCRGGSVIQLILHHGGSVGMTHINFAGAG